MAQPWKTLESIETDEGALELRQRGAKDFLITVGTQVLMNSLNNRSEIELGQLGCRHLKDRPAPRVLVGGLGMGYTLRAVLDCLPLDATVVVAELNPVVVDWCKGPLAVLTDAAVNDPRVTVEIADVSRLVRQQAQDAAAEKFDAVVFDLYRGPHPKTDPVKDPLYGSRSIRNVCNLLKKDGLFTIWGENHDEAFEKRLSAGGFRARTKRSSSGGYRHAVFIAEKQTGQSGQQAARSRQKRRE